MDHRVMENFAKLIVRFDDEWIVDWIQQNDWGEGEDPRNCLRFLGRYQNTQTEWKEATGRIYLTDVYRLWSYMESHLGHGKVRLRFNLPTRLLLME